LVREHHPCHTLKGVSRVLVVAPATKKRFGCTLRIERPVHGGYPAIAKHLIQLVTQNCQRQSPSVPRVLSTAALLVPWWPPRRLPPPPPPPPLPPPATATSIMSHPRTHLILSRPCGHGHDSGRQGVSALGVVGLPLTARRRRGGIAAVFASAAAA